MYIYYPTGYLNWELINQFSREQIGVKFSGIRIKLNLDIFESAFFFVNVNGL